ASFKPADEPEAPGAIGRDPGIEERLRAIIEVMLACGEVVDEAAGGVDVGAAACGDAWRDLVLPVGLCSADDVPAGVAGEHAAHFGVSNIGDDLGSVAVQPGDVLIACRQR